MRNRPLLVFISALASAAAFAQEPTDDVIETVRRTGKHTVLLSLLDKSGMTIILRQPGSDNQGYTLLAPTDEAFKQVPRAVMEDLQGNQQRLEQWMKYHILAGTTSSGNLSDGFRPTTLQGEALAFRVADNAIRVNDSLVSSRDLRARNGVVHVIDTVLMPMTMQRDFATRGIVSTPPGRLPTDPKVTTRGNPGTTGAANQPIAGTILSVANSLGSFTTFGQLIGHAELTEELGAAGPMTVLVPTDAAFAALPPAALQALREDRQLLTAVLNNHIVPRTITIDRNLNGSQIETAGGGRLMLRVGPRGEAKFGSAVVLKSGVQATNGTIHTINRVLLPLDVIRRLEARGIRIDQ